MTDDDRGCLFMLGIVALAFAAGYMWGIGGFLLVAGVSFIALAVLG